VDSFFHADPHPGNVFLTDDGCIALLELGMVGRIAPTLRDQLLKLVIAVSEAQGEEAGEQFERIGEKLESSDGRELRSRIGERELISGLRRIANRIALGVVLAALIVGSTLLTQVPTPFRIIGYPGLVMIFFLVAVAGGAALADLQRLAGRGATGEAETARRRGRGRARSS
jgi:ubiquinone biosynthesis protein